MQKLIPFAELESVPGFEVIRNNGRLLFQAQVEALVPSSYGDGERSKTFKVNFTDDQSLIEEDYSKKIRTYSFDKLKKEIINVASSHRIAEDGSLIQTRNSTTVTNSTLAIMINGVEQAFDDACYNLLDYYKYLLEEKKKASEHSAIITQRTDDGGHKCKPINPSFPKLADPIDFVKREQFLESLDPESKITIQVEDNDGKISDSDSYSVYMYHNNLLKSVSDGHEGYLFVAEPISSERETRLFYLSSEEFENFKMKEEKEEDKITQIAMRFLEMSPKEFSHKRKGTATMNHTVLDTFKERVLFYKDGAKAKSITGTKIYKAYLDKLYGKDINLPYYKPKAASDIGVIAATASSIDNTFDSFTHSFNDQKKAPAYTTK